MCRAAFAFLVYLLLACPVQAQRYNVSLDPAPTGFSWQPLPASKAAMLLPEGWYFKAETAKGADTYYFTQEEIGESGEFQTGLSLQVIRKVAAKTKRRAPEYAELLMLRMGFGPGQKVLEKEASVAGKVHRYAVRYRDAPSDDDARIVFQLALANAKTDTLYLLSFESPEKDWAEAWKLGELMVQELVLDASQ